MKKYTPKSLRVTLTLLLSAFILIYLNHVVSFQSFSISTKLMFFNYIPYLFECLIFLAFTLVFYAVSGKPWISVFIVQLFYLTLTIISILKQSINGSPLFLKDFEFVNNLSELAGFSSGKLSFSPLTAFIIFLNIIVIALLFYFERKKEKTSIKSRLVFMVSGVIIGAIFFNPVMYRVNHSISIEQSTEEEKIAAFGAVNGLYFTYSSKAIMNLNPTNFEIKEAQKEVDSAIEKYSFSDNTPITPNVIFIMSEAFFDITELPGVSYSSDPCPVFHKLSQEGTSGKFISPTFSGGTGYVEAEVLTGLCGKNLNINDNLTSLSTDSYKRMPVITDVFKNYGYETTFVHSYNSELYNRKNMYAGFGFDNIYFHDSFPKETERHNELISDSDLTKKIISLIEEKDEKPLFMYAVSMENHYPYINGKYAPDERINVKSKKLDTKELEILNALADGINGADTALGELIDYLKTETEPYMVIFFGDHLPNLSTTDGKSLYTSLGVSSSNITSKWNSDELYKMLKTDYVIWTNYDEETVFPDKTEGSMFLGLNILKRLNFNLTDYYIYLDSCIAKNTLLYRERLYVDADEKCYKTVPESDLAQMNNYKTAVRDIIYGNNEIFSINR